MAAQTLRGSQYGAGLGSGDGVTLNYPAGGNFASLHIKQEIQIPQVSSLTSSPDSSPSPIAVALGQAGLGNMVGPSQQTAQTAPASLQIVSDQRASNQPALQISPEHAKMWVGSPKSFQFDGGSSAPPQQHQTKMSPMIRDFVQSLDDREWQNSLFGLLQNQTYNQCEVDLFELMCKVLDQNLFSQVDWARNSIFFKELKVRTNV